MNTDTAFKSFDPAAVPDGTYSPPAADKPAKPKRERKPRAAAKKPKPAKAAIPPAPKHVRPTRKKSTAAKTVDVVRKARKRREPPKTGRALKLDMASAMAISATLKPTDFKMFESLTETLQSVNKATRRRVLAAIGKVFG